MIPAQNFDIATGGPALLTSVYANKPGISALVTAFSNRFQVLESQMGSILNGINLANHPMPGGPWDVLDKYGLIVGESRQGRSDAAYLPALRLRVLVNNSHGLVSDIIAVASAILTPGGYTFVYSEAPDQTFLITALGIPDADIAALFQYLPLARDGGADAHIIVSSPGDDVLIWGNTWDAATTLASEEVK
jgi:hypothetical protein